MAPLNDETGICDIEMAKPLFTEPNYQENTHCKFEDDFMTQPSENRPKGVVISTNRDAIIHGDVIGGDKVANYYYLEGSNTNSANTIQTVIRDIQTILYSDNNRLPYALTLCFDLCSMAKLRGEYTRWLAKELSGFNYRTFESEFDKPELFEAWMNTWTAHRRIEAHIKLAYRSSEDGIYHTDKWPYNKVFLAFPLAEIVRTIENAKNAGTSEFSIELRTLGEEHFDELQAFIAKKAPKMEVPRNLSVFYNVAALEKVLNGVRNKILELVDQVRQTAV